jgi:hypothetical protein
MKDHTDNKTFWSLHHKRRGREWLLFVQLKNGHVDVEDGPSDPTARSHEGAGGRQSFASFLSRPAPWTQQFPQLAASVRKVVAQHV